MLKIGAHVSIAKGLVAAIDKAEAIGADCIQVFSSSPRSFWPPIINEERGLEFKTEAKKRQIGPNFVHAGYLINLGSGNADLLKKSITRLSGDMTFAQSIGAAATIVHTGSHVGMGFAAVLATVVDAIISVLSQTPPDSRLLLETASGGKGKIGSTFEELSQILTRVDSSRVGVCLDTCHLFAGGYRFDTAEKVNELAAIIKNTIGWNAVGCMHTNDSKGDYNSAIDRHENIGQGKIGTEPFGLLLNRAEFARIPCILETPGFDDKGPDKENIDILRGLV